MSRDRCYAVDRGPDLSMRMSSEMANRLFDLRNTVRRNLNQRSSGYIRSLTHFPLDRPSAMLKCTITISRFQSVRRNFRHDGVRNRISKACEENVPSMCIMYVYYVLCFCYYCLQTLHLYSLYSNVDNANVDRV